MKKALLAIVLLIILVLGAAMFSTPKAHTSTIEVEVPLESLQK